MKANTRIRASVLLGCASASLLFAEQWLTFGGDPQHDGWAREEAVLNKNNVKSLKLIWKAHINSTLKEMTGLTAPVVAENVLTAEGHKDIVVVAGASDTLDAVDIDTGKILWHKQFQAEGAPKQEPRWLCPNALTDTPVIELGGGTTRRDRTVHVISSDGKLHSLNIVNGEDRKPPIRFVPAFSKNWSLNLVDGMLYTSTSQGCNAAHSGVYAMDLTKPERPVSFFETGVAGGGIWGRAGVTVGTNHNVYAATGDGPYDAAKGKYGDALLSLSPKDLKLIDSYIPANWAWLNRKDLDMGNISPLSFPFKQWDLVAAGGKEGRLFLLDGRSPGGADHQTPLFRSPIYSNAELYSAGRGFWGSFASWQDEGGARWIYAPSWGPINPELPAFPLTNGPAADGAILAFKIEEKEGKPVASPAWMSANMQLPESPIVANGVLYSVSSGSNELQADGDGHLMTSAERIKKASGHAVLMAMDAATGKLLYASGETMSAIAHFSGIAISNGRVFATTIDSNLYSFGLPDDSR